MPDVGCAGILVQDTFCGPILALPPEGALVVLNEMPVKAGGCAANVAIDLAKQGVSVDIKGCVGDDSAADFLHNIYESNGVGCSSVVRMIKERTSQCFILLVHGQDRRYLYAHGANGAFEVKHLSCDWLAKLKVFYLGGLFALPSLRVEALAEVLQFCRSKGVLTVVDVVVPEGVTGMQSLDKVLPFVDVFTPNRDEARAFTGLAEPLDQLNAFRAAGARTVIVTCGSDGAVAMQEDETWRCGAYQMDVIDPSGSGDAFTSGVIRCALKGYGLPDTLRYASAVGASVTRAPGTSDSIFSAEEAEQFVRRNPLSVNRVI
jgi:sugar/nucleoside kinase (ribokinase family)